MTAPGGDGPGFTVSTAQVRAHAASVREAAGSMGQAADAGETARGDAGAFGQLCSFLPAVLDPVEQIVVQVMRASASSLTSAAGGLDATAGTYDAHETANTDAFTGLHSRLGSGSAGGGS